jgi:hypothetical protein
MEKEEKAGFDFSTPKPTIEHVEHLKSLVSKIKSH